MFMEEKEPKFISTTVECVFICRSNILLHLKLSVRTGKFEFAPFAPLLMVEYSTTQFITVLWRYQSDLFHFANMMI